MWKCTMMDVSWFHRKCMLAHCCSSNHCNTRLQSVVAAYERAACKVWAVFIEWWQSCYQISNVKMYHDGNVRISSKIHLHKWLQQQPLLYTIVISRSSIWTSCMQGMGCIHWIMTKLLSNIECENVPWWKCHDFIENACWHIAAAVTIALHDCNQLWQRMSELYVKYGLYPLNHDKVVIKYRMWKCTMMEMSEFHRKSIFTSGYSSNHCNTRLQSVVAAYEQAVYKVWTVFIEWWQSCYQISKVKMYHDGNVMISPKFHFHKYSQ